MEKKRNGGTGKKKKVTYLDLSKCVASEEDTLPDINTQEFTGAQRNEEDIGDERKDFPGTQVTGALITGALNKKNKLFTGTQILDTEDDWIVMGAPDVTGAQSFTGAHEYVQVTGAPQEHILITGAPFTSVTSTHTDVTGAHITGA